VVGPAAGQQLQAAGELDDLAVDVDRRVTGRVEDLVDAELVVVAGDEIERDLAVGQPLGGEGEPLLHALAHEPVQELVASRLVGREPLRLGRRGDERVIAHVGDVALQRGQFLVATGGAMHAEEVGLVPRRVGGVRVLDDGDDRLAREIARQQGRVGLVDIEPDGVDELAPGLLGGVQVRGDVEPRGHDRGALDGCLEPTDD
jgi:hypothetical protein